MWLEKWNLDSYQINEEHKDEKYDKSHFSQNNLQNNLKIRFIVNHFHNKIIFALRCGIKYVFA